MCTGGFRIEFHFALTPCETPWFTVVNSEGLRLCRDAHMQWGDLGHCGVCAYNGGIGGVWKHGALNCWAAAFSAA